jgi:hypothetical protein
MVGRGFSQEVELLLTNWRERKLKVYMMMLIRHIGRALSNGCPLFFCEIPRNVELVHKLSLRQG